MAGGLRHCRKGCVDEAGNPAPFKGALCSHRKKTKLPMGVGQPSGDQPLIYVPDALGHSGAILPAFGGAHDVLLPSSSAEEPDFGYSFGQPEPIAPDNASLPTFFNNLQHFDPEISYSSSMPSLGSSISTTPDFCSTNILSNLDGSVFDDLFSALQDVVSSQDISELQGLLDSQHISTEVSNDMTLLEPQDMEDQSMSVNIGDNVDTLHVDVSRGPSDTEAAKKTTTTIRPMTRRKRKRLADSDIEDDENDEKRDEVKYVEDDHQRSKRHSERVARLMNSLKNLDTACCPYIFFYVSRPESVLARNGKAKMYLSEPMKAACGVDNKLGISLHDKVKCHVEEQILSYEHIAALNMSVQKAREEKRMMEHQLAVQEKKAQEETHRLQLQRAALEEQVATLRLHEQMRDRN